MGAVVYDQPECSAIFGMPPSFSFNELAEIHAEAPISYEVARAEMIGRRLMLGEEWYRHNEELAQEFWQRKRPWWL